MMGHVVLTMEVQETKDLGAFSSWGTWSILIKSEKYKEPEIQDQMNDDSLSI